MTKLCKRCNKYKTRSQYAPSQWTKDGTYCAGCNSEYQRDWKIRHGIVAKQGCALPPKKPRNVGTGYHSVHKRLAKARGRAAEYVCACGVQAEEWSYDHTDPNPIHGYTSRGIATEWSLDLSQYTPMCKPCHTRFDCGRRGELAVFSS